MASSAADPSSSNPTAPHISIRKYIRWLPGGSSEPTSTLVLTSSNHNYVDIRARKLLSAEFDPIPITEVDWAFAGTSHTTTNSSRSRSKPTTPSGSTIDLSNRPSSSSSTSTRDNSKSQSDSKSSSSGNRKPITHTVWKHWVDSLEPAAENVVDEGDSVFYGDGTNETLETGKMVNPATGQLQSYEELWKDVPAQTVGKEEFPVTVVLRAENPLLATRGMIIRVGVWCQGILRVGNEVGIERWRYRIVASGIKGVNSESYDGTQEGEPWEEGGWEKVVGSGEPSLPCAVCWVRPELKVGEEIYNGGLKWEVIERTDGTPETS